MPYGSPYDGQYREGPGYAGHVTDTQTNLTYMQQCYYDRAENPGQQKSRQ